MGRERNIPEKYKGRYIWSISRLFSFHDCQYSFFLNYIMKKEGKPNIYSALGSKIHSLLELGQENKISNDEMIKEFHNILFECKEIAGYKFPSEKVEKNFVESIEHYLKHYKPVNAKKFDSELEFYTEIAGSVLIGYIDGVVYNHDDTIEVVDYKTSTKYAKKDLDKKGLQLIVYAIAMEQEYGVKISKVSWNMLKYCQIDWIGATKPRSMFVLRNEVVSSLKSELLKDLRKLNMNETEIELLLEQAIRENDMTLFPQEIQDKYVISDGYVEYELSDRTRKLLEDFVASTVAEIEAKPKDNIGVWKAKDIEKEGNFFCSVLCDFKNDCPHYHDWLDSNKDKFEKTSTPDDDLRRLFG